MKPWVRAWKFQLLTFPGDKLEIWLSKQGICEGPTGTTWREEQRKTKEFLPLWRWNKVELHPQHWREGMLEGTLGSVCRTTSGQRSREVNFSFDLLLFFITGRRNRNTQSWGTLEENLAEENPLSEMFVSGLSVTGGSGQCLSEYWEGALGRAHPKGKLQELKSI